MPDFLRGVEPPGVFSYGSVARNGQNGGREGWATCLVSHAWPLSMLGTIPCMLGSPQPPTAKMAGGKRRGEAGRASGLLAITRRVTPLSDIDGCFFDCHVYSVTTSRLGTRLGTTATDRSR